MGLEPDSVDTLLREAESRFICATAGSVPLHLDDGNPLPFGGTRDGGTTGPSAFGKRKVVTQTADMNPQALLLNYPPQPTEENISCWERNYKSSMFLDPNPEMEAKRLTTSNYSFLGTPTEPSYLAVAARTYGDVRRTDCTRPVGSPAFYPPERTSDVTPGASEYTWKWPAREPRAPQPQLQKPPKPEQSFIVEYSLRAPWFKY